MIFDRHANLKYKYGSRSFWCRGYYVDTVGKNDVTGYIQMVNNQIMLVAEYEEEVVVKEGVLDEIAHENKTLYDMFVSNNYAPNNMDSLRSLNENYTNYYGVTTLQSQVYPLSREQHTKPLQNPWLPLQPRHSLFQQWRLSIHSFPCHNQNQD